MRKPAASGCHFYISLLAFVGMFGLHSTTSAAAETGVIEEIVVLGSHVAGTPEDAAVPVEVHQREDLEAIGSPSLKDLVKNLGASSGIDGESNQFTAGTQGVGRATINLRGLGTERTLVLFNGRRQVTPTPVGISGPDLNSMPLIALQRVEILKDGAAALYGSDAIGGVVNLITRKDFEGFEVGGSFTDFDEGSGDYDVGFIYGVGNDEVHFMFAAEYLERSEVAWRDKDWSNVPFSVTRRPYSSIGVNTVIPGIFIPGGGRQNYTPISGTYYNDPQCEPLGGQIAGNCFFKFSDFDNIAEDHEVLRLASNLSVDFGEHHFNLDVMYSEMEARTATSPSFPPTNLFGNAVPETSPHWQDFISRVTAAGGPSDAIFGAAVSGLPVIPVIRGRPVNVGQDAGPQYYTDDAETYRISASLDGMIGDTGLGYNVAVTYSENSGYNTLPDVYVERLYNAFQGFGGPGCDPATGTAGVGSCEYFNPFLSAVPRSAANGVVNPDYDPALANSPELIRWLYGELGVNAENSLLVVDAVVNGDLPWEMGAGAVQFAAGLQYRLDESIRDSDRQNDPAFNPCPFAGDEVGDPDCATATGLFGFFPANASYDVDREIFGAFGEVVLPVSERLEFQVAARYEDYGGSTGSTFNPKFAARFDAADWLTLRGSVGTTFRGPTNRDLNTDGRALVFLLAPLAFKAVDTKGNRDLDAEEALAYNFGVVVNAGGFSATVDYWRFDFEDLIETESSSALVNAYVANDCADGGTGVGSSACDLLRARIFPTGVSASSLERVEVNRFNGPDVDTSGIDFNVSYTFDDVAGGQLRLGLEGTHTLEYEVGDSFFQGSDLLLQSGYDAVGSNNRARIPFRSLQDWKGNASINFSRGGHNLRLVARYVDDYEATSVAEIDSLTTYDLHYVLTFNEDRTTLSLSAVNLTDEDPPLNIDHELLYDPFTHNPLGRMLKLGLNYRF